MASPVANKVASVVDIMVVIKVHVVDKVLALLMLVNTITTSIKDQHPWFWVRCRVAMAMASLFASTVASLVTSKRTATSSSVSKVVMVVVEATLKANSS